MIEWLWKIIRSSENVHTANENIRSVRTGYSKEREHLHMQIVKKLTFPCATSNQPIAILIGGGTATGKTKMRKTLIMKEIKKFPDEFCIVDADEIKAEIPEYDMYLKSDKANAASLVHKESTDIRDKALDVLINNKCCFIYEGTMAKKYNYSVLISKLRNQNYSIEVWISDITVEVAIARAKKREKMTGRRVPSSVIRNTHKLVSRTFQSIKSLVDEYYIFNNDAGFRLIYSKHYINKKEYELFCEKALSRE
ncbi:hypothetical protein BTR23_14085 [Alkalihalophilus pseudofirmus]|nr:hypothetical protein BTR23_14085 [Alkalihalophilus pseudofirmus]